MPASRRKAARSSDSNDSGYAEVNSIEEFLARKDKYRVVDPGPPLAYPIYKTSPETVLRGLIEKLKPEVVQLLSSFEITASDLLLRLWHAYPGDQVTANVFHVVTTDTNPAVWQAAAKSLVSLFFNNGAAALDLEHPFQVEISNPDISYHDISRCLPNDPPLLELFNRKKDAITEIVSTELPSLISAISFHNRIPHSKRLTECVGKHTVMIYCRPGIPANFSSVEERLIDLFQDATADIHIEFLPGVVWNSILPDLGAPQYLPDIPRKPVNGSSISTEGGINAGSLGGWVYLNLPNSPPLMCMLTCYHVVRAINPAITSVTDRDGVTLENDTGHVDVVYPAEIDKSLTIEKFEQDRLAGKGEMLKEFEDTWAEILQKRSIGRVLCASGYRLSGRSRVDWALVDASETFTANRPPSRSNFSPNHKKPNPVALWGPNEDFQAREFGNLREGDWVAFRGRGSGVVSGEVNTIRSRIFWPVPNLTSDEWEVLPLGDGSFTLPGDSGSMVFNSKGQIVGLNMAKVGEAGYITTVETIQKDVKELTGGFLSLEN
ncbi:hypothetical protein ACJ72_03563 [Emergomyces africanus]|uniref:Uncharacterized protein n=1 Tax=Emergomyces africanus TaxID=1955775 RepID=A0A1B7NZ76_9EURO|nr:hypothetical protein ACJ72_03563 [Emergomyces africanus]